MPKIDLESLMRLALASASVTRPCSYNMESLAAWRALPCQWPPKGQHQTFEIHHAPYIPTARNVEKQHLSSYVFTVQCLLCGNYARNHLL